MENIVYIVLLVVLLAWLASVAIFKADTVDELLRNVLYVLIGILLGWIVYSLLAPLAYAERGYFAIGGEGLLGYMIAWFVGPMLIWSRDEIIARLRRKMRQRRQSGNQSYKRTK